MGRIKHLRLHRSLPAETGLSPEELTVLLGEREKSRRDKGGEHHQLVPDLKSGVGIQNPE